MISPTHLHSRPVGGGSPRPDQVGARAQVRGRDGGTGPFGVAVRPGGPWERMTGAHRLRARLNASAGPGGVGCGGSPQGAAGAVEDPLDQGAELLFCVVRVLMAASPPRRSTRTWILSDSGTPMVIGQLPVYREEQSLARNPR